MANRPLLDDDYYPVNEAIEAEISRHMKAIDRLRRMRPIPPWRGQAWHDKEREALNSGPTEMEAQALVREQARDRARGMGNRGRKGKRRGAG